MGEGRWLDRDQVALHLSIRVDEIARLQRAGKLPAPSYHFGPRSPRYDRRELDRLFTDAQPENTVEAATETAVNAIIQRARKNRQKAAIRRIG